MSSRLRQFAVLLSIGLAIAWITATPESAQSWRLVWSDEFNGPVSSPLNTAHWRYDIGTQYPGGPAQWGTGEVEAMTDSTDNVFQDGAGHLVIKPLHSGPSARTGWTSGRVETEQFFDAPSGGAFAVEAAIQQPNVTGPAAAGYWPAFWMLGSAFRGNYQNWPRIGEIDVMETVNGRDSLFVTLHCGTAPGGPCHEFTGLSSGERPCPGCRTSFHVYRVEVHRESTPQQIRWYLDTVNIFTLDSTAVDASTWADATNHSFFVILNVAIGGGFPDAFGGGPTDATASGVPMVVDYLRVYKRSAKFTDDELVAGTSEIRAVHVLELRMRINNVRVQRNLSPITWAEPITERSTPIRASHIVELRTALSETYSAFGLALPEFDPTLAIGGPIRAIHITEVRSAVAMLE
jgi:beta-glucanase (GH16 family)